MRCKDPRYQALAWLIKRNTNAGHEWVIRELDMGHRKQCKSHLKRNLHICIN